MAEVHPSRWFEWRYAAAGFGAGAAVGVATGLLAGLFFVGSVLFGGAGSLGGDEGASGLWFSVVTLPLLGIVAGLFAGALVGIPTGLVLALVGPRFTQVRPARIAMFVATVVAGTAFASWALWLPGAGLGDVGGMGPGALSAWLPLALPCVAGGYLVSRMVPSVLRERARLAGHDGARSTTPPRGAQSLHS